MTKQSTLEWRVSQLEKNYCDLDNKIERILTNHLPHIQEEIQRLATIIGTATAINVGAIIIGLLIAKYL